MQQHWICTNTKEDLNLNAQGPRTDGNCQVSLAMHSDCEFDLHYLPCFEFNI